MKIGWFDLILVLQMLQTEGSTFLLWYSILGVIIEVKGSRSDVKKKKKNALVASIEK